ncbi:unnamed protein product [Fusarium graminearum]|uniref:Uncharacterized protein n=1 Tax=Gibberella zeae TaxID=5518 RepID=A0A4E9DBS3_GIBZA|nr:unnamed protein product [Fusarium graminearum]
MTTYLALIQIVYYKTLSDEWLAVILLFLQAASQDRQSESELQEPNTDELIPTETLNEIDTIPERDGSMWEQCVLVTMQVPSYVSAPCTIDDQAYAIVAGWDWEPNLHNDKLWFIHPVCLGFLCGHNDITPEQLWDSFYDDESRYDWREDRPIGLVHSIWYFEMEDRTGDTFLYDFLGIARIERSEWLLARPTYLPVPKSLRIPPIKPSSSRSLCKVFEIPELLDNILDHVVDVPVNVIESELRANHWIWEAPSATIAAKTLLSLTQVNRSFYHAIVGNRQDLFFEAARNFGWMLPFTQADWADSEWPDTVTDTFFTKGPSIDWRAYMMNCLRNATPNIHNRWRFHKMAVEFGRGGRRHFFDKDNKCLWNAGSVAFKPDLKRSKLKGWEVGVRWW